MYTLASNLEFTESQIIQPISSLGVYGKEDIFENFQKISNPEKFCLRPSEKEYYTLIAEELLDRGILIPEKETQELLYLKNKFPLKRQKTSFFNTKKISVFTSSIANYDIAFLGVPSDLGSTRPGTRYGVELLREQSLNYNFKGQLLDLRSRSEVNLKSICDIGNLIIEQKSDVDGYKALENIYNRIPPEVIPFMIGGDHSYTYSAVSSQLKKFEDLHYIHIDSHTDIQTWNSSSKEIWHSNFLSILMDENPKLNIHLRGVRPYISTSPESTKDVLSYIEKLKSISFDSCADENHLIGLPKNKNVYISIDVDVLNSNILEQTGHPNPDGIKLSALKNMIDFLISNNKVAGIDIMEFGKSSNRDQHRREAQLISRLILECVQKIQREI